jgi:hypothetical protein
MSALQTLSAMSRKIELGGALLALAEDQAAWSQATFGTDTERGPVGALKHAMTEAADAVAAWKAEPFNAAAVLDQLADVFLLVLDASRRAGVAPYQLVTAATEKQLVNRARTWPAPAGPDEYVEHIRPTTLAPLKAAPEPVAFCWGKPGGSRMFHVFHGTRSLCGRWMFGGADEAIDGGSITRRPGDCVTCVTRFNAHHKPAK